MSEPQILALIGDLLGLTDLHEFHGGLLHAVRTAIPVDWISLNDLADDAADTVVLIEPPFPLESHEVYARHAFENPLVVRHQRTGDGRAYRFSDVCTPEELRATALYREFYAQIGLEYQIAFTLPHKPGRLLALALSRRDEDFSDAERALLDAARPYLIQIYRNAVEHSHAVAELEARSYGPRLPLDDPALRALFTARAVTVRQAEVLSWVASGRSDRKVAVITGVSERTVQKHLQGCFAKLGVHSRTEAVALAWSAIAAAGNTLASNAEQ